MGALPKHYHDTLKNFYYLLHPPRERSELEEASDIGETKVIDFDKMNPHRRSLLRHNWDRATEKGDPV